VKQKSRFLSLLLGLILLSNAVGAFAALLSPNRYVEIDITGPVNEKRALYEFIFPRFRTVKQYLDLLEKAQDDPDVGGIILKISHPELGWAKLQQLRRGIFEFRNSGKKVYALLTGDTLPAYLLASACDEVDITPAGSLMITGLRIEAYFFKDLLAKLGIEVDAIPIGKYKSAAEPFTDRFMSDASREMFTSLLDDYYEQLMAMLAKDRRLTSDTVRAILDRGPFTASEAREIGLIDNIMYEKELHKHIEAGLPRYLYVVKDYGKQKPQVPEINIFTLLFKQPPVKPSRTGRTKIALIVTTGIILPGGREDYPFQENIIAAKDLIEQINECVDNPDIAAIVLRIDSPGGSALASDLIWRAIRLARKKKPVVASLSDVAASGGYYVAMGADKVIAEPGTITGSIGVISGKLVLKGLFDKVGINTEVISRGKNSGIFSPGAPFSKSERAALRRLSTAVYDGFVGKVAESRGLTKDDVRAAAQGRVWTGRQALKNHLVDKLGGIDEAIGVARTLAHIPRERRVEVEVYPRQLGLIEFIQKVMSGQLTQTMVPKIYGATFPFVNSDIWMQALPLIHLFRRETVLALMPFHIEIK